MNLLRLIKTNFAKISPLSLINLVGMSVFCVALFSCNILICFRISTFFNKREIKIRFRSTVFFGCNNTQLGPILHSSFNDWITDIFRCSVNLVQLLNVKIGYDIRKEFIQIFGSFFITPYNFVTLNNPYFLIRDNFV